MALAAREGRLPVQVATALAREERVTRLALSEAEAAELVGGDVRGIYDASGGNPYYLEQLHTFPRERRRRPRSRRVGRARGRRAGDRRRAGRARPGARAEPRRARRRARPGRPRRGGRGLGLDAFAQTIGSPGPAAADALERATEAYGRLSGADVMRRLPGLWMLAWGEYALGRFEAALGLLRDAHAMATATVASSCSSASATRSSSR